MYWYILFNHRNNIRTIFIEHYIAAFLYMLLMTFTWSFTALISHIQTMVMKCLFHRMNFFSYSI